jgi:hypothetical protein
MLLRQTYSPVFAWLGRCSLELFILQVHILLAADANAVLSLGIFQGDGTLRHDRWRDLAFLAPVFIWLSWRVKTATQSVTSWIVDGFSSDGRSLSPPRIARKKKSSVDERVPIRSEVPHRKLSVSGLKSRIGMIVVVVWILHLIS